jgi:hypothetical protein
MKINHFGSVALTMAVAVSAGVTACGGGPGSEGQSQEQAVGAGTYNWWRIERTARQLELDAYLVEHADQFESFKNTALGNLGVPMIMMRLFPEIFPEIWGGPSDHFAPVGFAQDPYEPYRALPLGLGYAGSTPAVPTPIGPVNVNVVTLTCMGCHGGRVQGPDGSMHTVIGAPNTQFQNFRGAIYMTTVSPKYTADTFRAALQSKPLGWVYNDPAQIVQEELERQIFMAGADQFLAQVKQGSAFLAQRFAQTLGAYTYQVPNAPSPYIPTPGYLDAIGAGISVIVDPTTMTPAQVKAAVPPYPAPIDIMSVWRQDDRPAAQWDGSIQDHTHRNLAAEFGVVGDPSHISMANVNKTTPFTAALPATPYPFDVERDAAARGQTLFAQNCSSCHYAGNAKIFSLTDTGTDPNRAIIWTPYSVVGLRTVLRAACTDPVTCNHPDGTPLLDSEIVNPTGGYMALPLDGIWARGPYLHNGSVPTIAALLTGDRPAQFYRGNIAYDTVNVGFMTAAAPGAAPYDTTRSGNANTGHMGTTFNGSVDWKNEPGKLHDILEYLKTL